MNGFTTIRDVAAFVNGYVTVDLKRAIEGDLITGPGMLVSPHMITPSGGHADLSGCLKELTMMSSTISSKV